MSDESDSKLKKFIEQYDVKFPIIRSQNAMSAFGARAYPTFAFIGPDGQLIQDTGRKPSTSAIITALKSVFIAPEAPKSSRLNSLIKAFDKHKYVDAARQLSTLSQATLNDEEQAYLEQAHDFFDQVVKQTTENIASLAEGPNFYSAKSKLIRISKSFKGLPTGAEADAELARFKKDKEIGREISAMKKLRAMKKKYPLSKSSSVQKLMDAIDRFNRKYASTYAGGKAKALRERISTSMMKR